LLLAVVEVGADESESASRFLLADEEDEDEDEERLVEDVVVVVVVDDGYTPDEALSLNSDTNDS
jgi:hypothetical protein